MDNDINVKDLTREEAAELASNPETSDRLLSDLYIGRYEAYIRACALANMQPLSLQALGNTAIILRDWHKLLDVCKHPRANEITLANALTAADHRLDEAKMYVPIMVAIASNINTDDITLRIIAECHSNPEIAEAAAATIEAQKQREYWTTK